MPVLLSIIILLCDRTLIIESIPKLGHILSDPLSNEAKLFGTDIKNIILNLTNNTFHTSTEEHKHLVMPLKFDLRKTDNKESTQRPSYGYDFNDTNCKTLDDRVICGYDKNLGQVDNKTVDLGNGCRIRGNRLECGYLTGPFNNTRRPPANDSDKKQENSSPKTNITGRRTLDTSIPGSIVTLTSMTSKKNTKTSTKDIKATTRVVKNITATTLRTQTFGITSRSSTLTTPPVYKISGTEAAVTKSIKKHCVEKKDSIFCYDIKS